MHIFIVPFWLAIVIIIVAIAIGVATLYGIYNMDEIAKTKSLPF